MSTSSKKCSPVSWFISLTRSLKTKRRRSLVSIGLWTEVEAALAEEPSCKIAPPQNHCHDHHHHSEPQQQQEIFPLIVNNHVLQPGLAKIFVLCYTFRYYFCNREENFSTPCILWKYFPLSNTLTNQSLR